MSESPRFRTLLLVRFRDLPKEIRIQRPFEGKIDPSLRRYVHSHGGDPMAHSAIEGRPDTERFLDAGRTVLRELLRRGDRYV